LIHHAGERQALAPQNKWLRSTDFLRAEGCARTESSSTAGVLGRRLHGRLRFF